MFSAAYSYYNGVPVWFTGVLKYNAAEDAYTGKVQIWQNGAMSMLPADPFPTDSGNETIRFTSADQAEMTYRLIWPTQVNPTKITLKKFMDTVAPGTNDNRLSGWWWDPAYNGMGFFLEAQGGTLFGAWYHYGPDEQAQTAFGTWLSFSGPFENGAASFSTNLIRWQGGTSWDQPAYQTPVSTDTGNPISLNIKTDGKIDMHVGGDLNLDLKLERFRFGQAETASSLVGTWESASQGNYMALILTGPDAQGYKNYTWINECTEIGWYTVSGSTITFNMYETNCGQGSGLVGTGQAATRAPDPQDSDISKSYEFSCIGKKLDIKKVALGQQTIDLLLDFYDISLFKKVGSGSLGIERGRDLGGWEFSVVGHIPFSIYEATFFGPGSGRYEVYGYGEVKGMIEMTACINLAENHCCHFIIQATGLAEVRGYLSTARPDSNEECMLGIAVTDNQYWTNDEIVGLSGECGSWHIGDIIDMGMPVKAQWLEIPLQKGYVIHKAPMFEDYTLEDIQLTPDILCYTH
ncbi:MAG: hypothetical protein DSZ23_04265 [Thermodesulfatator sp.]|nr:MAG: hypothetical protein DSZ23_04265 [Thermodesulfatator sp.]